MTLVCFKQLRHTKSEKSSVKKRRIIVQEQEKYMKEALKEAKKAYEKLEIPVGAIIVKDGKSPGRFLAAIILWNAQKADLRAWQQMGTLHRENSERGWSSHFGNLCT